MLKIFSTYRQTSCRLAKSRRRLQIELLESRQLLTAVSMTNQEQLLLELINRARKAPATEAASFSIGLNQGLPPGTISNTSKQPLAPNQLLVNAARLHSQDMVDNNFFAHNNLQGKRAGDRVADAGYNFQAWGENLNLIYSTATINQTQSVFDAHKDRSKAQVIEAAW